MLIFLFCSLKLLLADLFRVGIEIGADAGGESVSDSAISSSSLDCEALASLFLSSSTGKLACLGSGDGGGGTSSVELGT